MLQNLLQHNKNFVEHKEYEKFITSKYPSKKVAILTCMDTRLTELLPAALGLKNGDVKLIKNAGAMISSPFGSVMRSLVVAIYDLNVEEVLVIGHHDCGMQCIDSAKIINKMSGRGIEKDKIDLLSYCGVNLEEWLNSFDSAQESVKATVGFIVQHPLIPKDISVHGLIMDPTTGAVEVLV